MFGTLGLQELFVIAIIAAGGLFWLWMLVDCVKHCPEKNKVLWVVVIAVTGCFGAIAYFVVHRKRILLG